ncbi:MAG TPA: hypothetical protein VMI53_14320 [Opitutaceae bacterium]|nr:hypothetical protein [Opitutaceae bacterium]
MKIIPLLPVALLAGCTSAPLPEGYKGPLAKIHDTSTRISSTEVYFCRLTDVDGRRVAADADQDVPAQRCLLSIEGIDHDAFDILGYILGMQHVDGQVVVTLESGREYYVRGRLSESGSGLTLAVWLEDDTHRRVSAEVQRFIRAPPDPPERFPPIQDWVVRPHYPRSIQNQ